MTKENRCKVSIDIVKANIFAMAIDKRINKHVEKYGEFAGEGFLANDGFCFKLSGIEHQAGKAPVEISFFTTFMPLSDMSKSQQEAIFEECMKDIDSLNY